MAIKVGINGFGRIGRMVFRASVSHPEIDVVGINDLCPADYLAYMLKYDTMHGQFEGTIESTEKSIIVNGKEIPIFAEKDPANLPWGEVGAEYVVESTGFFTDGIRARAHIDAGAKKVLITAIGRNVDKNIIMGVNDHAYNPATDNIISSASCTTNCLAPFAKVLIENFGIKRGFMNAIHAYTNDQRILDLPHQDLRRARAAAQSMIPTTTAAARAVSLVLPQLAGKLDGFAIRIPTPDGSMVDLTAELERDVTIAEVNAAMKAASEGSLKGILEYTEDPIVSIDVIGNPASSVFDSGLTIVLGGKGNLVKCVSWYDNEWGYSNRVKDLVKIML